MFRDEARACGLSFDGAEHQVHEQNEAEAFAFWNYGPELSRRFRALKIWLTLRYYGVRRIARTIAEDNAIAAYLGEQVEAATDFELLAAPELSICCFRYLPVAFQSRLGSDNEAANTAAEAELDQLNTQIMNAVQRGGAPIFKRNHQGKVCVARLHYKLSHYSRRLDQTLEIIREAAQELIS